jgi:hypothetical protein
VGALLALVVAVELSLPLAKRQRPRATMIARKSVAMSNLMTPYNLRAPACHPDNFIANHDD